MIIILRRFRPLVDLSVVNFLAALYSLLFSLLTDWVGQGRDGQKVASFIYNIIIVVLYVPVGGSKLSQLMSPAEPTFGETVKADNQGSTTIASFDVVDAYVLYTVLRYEQLNAKTRWRNRE